MRFEARTHPVKPTALSGGPEGRALFIRFTAADGGARTYLHDLAVVRDAIASARAEGEALSQVVIVGADALFSPAGDHAAGLDAALDAFANLLLLLTDEGLNFIWRTRGGIGDVLHAGVSEALVAAGPLASIEVGIPTQDEQLCRALEGGRGATPDERLRLMSAASARGVAVRALIDPLVPMLSDQTAALKPLLRSVADAGAHSVSVRYLVLTRSRAKTLSRRLSRMNRDLIRGCFADEPWRTPEEVDFSAAHQEPHKLLPPRLRRLGHNRIRDLATRLGLALTVLDPATEGEDNMLKDRQERRQAGRARLKARRTSARPQLDLFGLSAGGLSAVLNPGELKTGEKKTG